MADDLIIKFFRDDLNEAEEQALSERLSSSVEDAMRLGQHAETSYRHYGLPEPRWPGSPPPPGFPRPRGGFKLWTSLALLAGLLAWAGWKYSSKTGWNSKVPAAEAVSTPEPVLPKTKATSPPAASGGPGSHPHSAVSSPAASKGPALNSPTPAGGSVSPAVTPVNVAKAGHRAHSNLEVVVNQKKPGPVTVRVLSPGGSTVIVLYDGILQTGSWAFDWNGLLVDGAPPPPGTYQIQVQSGAVLLHKRISIKKQP